MFYSAALCITNNKNNNIGAVLCLYAEVQGSDSTHSWLHNFIQNYTHRTDSISKVYCAVYTFTK